MSSSEILLRFPLKVLWAIRDNIRGVSYFLHLPTLSRISIFSFTLLASFFPSLAAPHIQLTTWDSPLT
eukprot:12915571-Prorocentrum_lima.AAC.1